MFDSCLREARLSSSDFLHGREGEFSFLIEIGLRRDAGSSAGGGGGGGGGGVYLR